MLVERRTLSNADAIAVVEIAAEVKLEVASAAGESNKRMQESLTLLARMQSSFEADQNLQPAGLASAPPPRG